MAWVRIDDQAPHHRKLLKAGPAACWLWVCALAHSQRQLTDGVVTREAVPLLGVASPRGLIAKLLEVGLFDPHPDGWQIHDYLEFNDSRDEALAKRQQRTSARSEAGRKSGAARRAKNEQTDPVFVQAHVEQHGLTQKDGYGSGEGLDHQEKGVPPFRAWFDELVTAYPPQAVSRSYIAEQSFVAALRGASDGPEAAFRRMSANLASQQAGHQWRVKRMIPRLDRWLRDGLWEQRHEAEPVSALVGDKTARTLTSAEAFMREGTRGTR